MLASADQSGPPETVLALAGGDVVLPCSFNINANSKFPAVEWSKNGLSNYILLYRDGCEDHFMKNTNFLFRSSLIMSELKMGNVSLRISSVRLSDAGTFQCRKLWSKDHWEDTLVKLDVGR